jgi:hypothetical protein
MGPLTLADYVGLDTMLFILEGWVKKYPNDPSFFVPKSLKEKVRGRSPPLSSRPTTSCMCFSCLGSSDQGCSFLLDE